MIRFFLSDYCAWGSDVTSCEAMAEDSVVSQILAEIYEISNRLTLPNLEDLDHNCYLENTSSDNSESGEPDDPSNGKDVPISFIGRKEEESAMVKPCPLILVPNQTVPRTSCSTRTRRVRCGRCQGCLRIDCGKCVFCKDKKKFGGPVKKKQKCSLRTCTNLQYKMVGSYWT